jgi:hypothetical protein
VRVLTNLLLWGTVEEVETNPELMQVPVLKSLLFETFRYKANPKTPFLFTPLNTKRRKGASHFSFLIHLSLIIELNNDYLVNYSTHFLECSQLERDAAVGQGPAVHPRRVHTRKRGTHGPQVFHARYSLALSARTTPRSGLTKLCPNTVLPGTIYVLRTKSKLEGSGSFYWEIQIDQTSGNQELHIGIAEEHFKYGRTTPHTARHTRTHARTTRTHDTAWPIACGSCGILGAVGHFSFHTAYLRANGTHYIERSGGIMQGHTQIVQGPPLNTNDKYAHVIVCVACVVSCV